AGIDTVSQVGEKIEQGLKGILPSGDPNGLEDAVGTYVSTLAAIIDGRVKTTLAQADLPACAEIARLERRIRDLERRLDASRSSHAARRRKSPVKRTRKPKRSPR